MSSNADLVSTVPRATGRSDLTGVSNRYIALQDPAGFSTRVQVYVKGAGGVIRGAAEIGGVVGGALEVREIYVRIDRGERPSTVLAKSALDTAFGYALGFPVAGTVAGLTYLTVDFVAPDLIEGQLFRLMDAAEAAAKAPDGGCSIGGSSVPCSILAAF